MPDSEIEVLKDELHRAVREMYDAQKALSAAERQFSHCRSVVYALGEQITDAKNKAIKADADAADTRFVRGVM